MSNLATLRPFPKGVAQNPGGFSSEMRKQLQAARKLACQNAELAIAKMLELLNCGTPSVELAAANSILDHAQMKTEAAVAAQTNVENLKKLSNDELERIAAGGLASGS